VNEFTGGTAEAVAGALQDAQRAMVLGTRTEGKGSSIVTKKLSNGSALAIPVSRWYTPSGRLIQGTGIKPDIEVAMTLEDSILGMDFQLQDAYRYLNEEGELPVFR
jgi:carboxyl-terminal processing protease